MSLAARASRGAIFLMGSTVSTVLVGFVGGIVLARLLGPNDFGTFALATTLNAFIDLRNKLQLEQKFIRDQDTRAIFYDTFFTLNTAQTAISFVLLLCSAGAVLWFGRPDLAICLVVIGLLNFGDTLALALRLVLEREIAFGQIALILSIAGLAQFGVSLLAALAGMGVWSLLLGLAASTIVNLALILPRAPRLPRLRLDYALAREFLTYGVRYGLVFAMAALVLTQFDNLIIGALSGTAALGFYDRAYRTSLWPTVLISASLARISLPTYSRLQDDPARLSRVFGLSTWVVLSFTTPIALAVAVAAPDLVVVMYGEKWLPSATILQILALFAVLRPLWDDMISVMLATGRPGQLARVIAIQALVMVTLAVPLTWRFGSLGTAISVGCSFLLSAIFLAWFAHTHLKVGLLAAMGLPALNNLLALAGYLALRATLPLAGLAAWQRLLIDVTLLLLIYAAISLLTSRRQLVANLSLIMRAVKG